MKITKARRDELKPKVKKNTVQVTPNPVISPFLTKNMDNSDVLSRLDKIKEEVSRQPRSISVSKDHAPEIKEGNEAISKLMNDNTDRIIQAINEKKPSSMEMIPERRGGIIQRIIIKPL